MSTLWREGKMPDVGANPTQRQVHQFQGAVAFFPLVFAALTGASIFGSLFYRCCSLRCSTISKTLFEFFQHRQQHKMAEIWHPF
jgi:hypothetical protein